MDNNVYKLVNKLKKNNKTISFMESCTGGYLANSITNISGSSDVINFSAVTYSNYFKIKMGVDEEVISKYSVYSKETSISMSKAISSFSNSSYGVGITGKLNKRDKNNLYGEDNQVFICIYDKENDKYYTDSIVVIKDSREENKELVKDFVINKLLDILEE